MYNSDDNLNILFFSCGFRREKGKDKRKEWEKLHKRNIISHQCQRKMSFVPISVSLFLSMSALNEGKKCHSFFSWTFFVCLLFPKHSKSNIINRNDNFSDNYKNKNKNYINYT